MLKVRGTELRQAIYRAAGRYRRPACPAVLGRGAVPRSAGRRLGRAGRARHAGRQLPGRAQVVDLRRRQRSAAQPDRQRLPGRLSPTITKSMDFSFDDDHVALRDAVQRFCDGEYPAQHRGNAETAAQSAQRWAGMAELGLLGLPFDAELGGSGQGAVELMLVAQQLGRALAGGAWLANVVLGRPADRRGRHAGAMHGLAAAARGRRACRSRWPAAKPTRATTPPTCRRRRGATAATGSSTGARAWCCTATAPRCCWSSRAAPGQRHDRDGLTLFAIDAHAPGLRVQGFDTLDGGRAAHLELRGVRVAADRVDRRSRRGLAADRGGAGPRQRRAGRRGCRGDGGAARTERRAPAHTQAVRRAAGQVPGAAAPRGRHAAWRSSRPSRWPAPRRWPSTPAMPRSARASSRPPRRWSRRWRARPA